MVCVGTALLREGEKRWPFVCLVPDFFRLHMAIMNSPSESLQRSELHWRTPAAKETEESSVYKAGQRG